MKTQDGRSEITGTGTRQRLDQLLVAMGHFPTRSRARDAIERGTVAVDGATITRPGTSVAPSARVAVADPAQGYVSRAALKLAAGLDHFRFDPAGRIGLDIGASTGGFTQVLLKRGAEHVFAVDVGHDQMHVALSADPRVTSIERLNARDLTAGHLGDAVISCLVSDVSFISLKLALPPALRLCRPGSFAVLLVKPQFEAGRTAIGKGGLLRDPSLGVRIADDLSEWLSKQPGWHSLGVMPSPVTGSDGNQEFLLGGIRT